MDGDGSHAGRGMVPAVFGKGADVAAMSSAVPETVAAVARIAAEPVSVAERAEQILEVLGRAMPFDAASITVRDPERQARFALAAVGDTAALHAYFQTPQGDAELDMIGLNRPTPPLRHTDLPMPAAECLCWTDYLWPAGFGGSLGVGLFTADGRHSGHLTVLTESDSRPTLADRNLIGAVAQVMARAVDRMRTVRAAARLVHDATAGAVLTRGGNVEALPGLPPHPALAAGSLVLAEATERIDAGDAYAVFLHPSPGSADGRRRTAADQRAELRWRGRRHLRAVVLVSPSPDLRGLSHRDLEILGLVVEDWPDERIAQALGATAEDVAACIHRSGYLLAASSRTGLAVRVLREGLFLPRRMSDAVS
jgi:hypothetical protein